MSERLLSQLESSLNEFGLVGKRLTVAYSGGVDSTVLLHLMATLSERVEMQLDAVHINHRISVNAGKWSDHCLHVAKSLKIPLQIFVVDIKLAGDGLESAARRARYQVFERLDTDCVLLAHHAQDQAETILLNLLRGSGLRGMAGMPPVRPLSSRISLVRPLLNVAKQSILAFAGAADLSWVEDESNQSHEMTRNRLRHQVLPVFADINPGWESHFAFAANDARLALAEQDNRWQSLLDSVQVNGILSCRGLLDMEPYSRIQVLRSWLRKFGVNPGRAQLDQVVGMLNSREDSMPRVLLGQWVLLRFRNALYCELNQSVAAWSGELRVRLELGQISVPGGVLQVSETTEGGLCASLLGTWVDLRPRIGGESLRPSVGAARQCLKKLAQAKGVPPWMRNNRPYVYSGDLLAAVPGLWIDAAFQAPANAPGLSLVWSAKASEDFD